MLLNLEDQAVCKMVAVWRTASCCFVTGRLGLCEEQGEKFGLLLLSANLTM